MTDIVWGDPIEVNGVRPEWLRDDEPMNWRSREDENWYGFDSGGYTEEEWVNPIHFIRLPATHAYYLATSRGFTYWSGGPSAPQEWDGGEVLWEDGMESKPVNPGSKSFIGWKRTDASNFGHHIIGYRKRTEQPVIAPELWERAFALLRKKVKELEGYDEVNEDVIEARAIVAALPPEPDPDLTLAKSIMGDAEDIALAIKAARENGRG